MMHTSNVTIGPELNKFVWHKGIRNVPYRVRIKLERKRNEDDDAKEKMTTHVRTVPTTSVACAARARLRAPTETDARDPSPLYAAPQVEYIKVASFKNLLTENAETAEAE